MDEQDLDLDFEDPGGDSAADAEPDVFYWALKTALDRTPTEPPPAPAR